MSSRSRRRTTTEAERQLFREVLGQAERLTPTRVASGATTPGAGPSLGRAGPVAAAKPAAPSPPPAAQTATAIPDRPRLPAHFTIGSKAKGLGQASGHGRSGPPSPAPVRDPKARGTPGVDRQSDRRLRQGKKEIEGRIDLHGMTVARARQALTLFLLSSHSQGRRTVLVITGKGKLFDAESGKIKRALPAWLAESPLDRVVVNVAQAQISDGGEGAVYIHLRRHRAGGKSR